MKLEVAIASLSLGLLFLGCKKENDSPQTLATVSTSAVSGITVTGAVAGGSITNNGNLEVLEKGVCYSDTTATPFVYNTKVSGGKGEDAFTVPLSGLSAGTLYYVRAYSVNIKGTSYGNAVSFTTQPTGPLPVLTLATPDPATITGSSFTLNATLTSDAGLSVNQRGFCWSATKIPTINDRNFVDPGSDPSFQQVITGLNSATTYTVRAFASNVNGVGYSDPITVKTLAGVPRLTTQPVPEIVDGQVEITGTIDFNGNGAIISRGFIMDVDPNAPIVPENTYPVSGTDMGSFSYKFDNLLNYQQYYVRAYAQNSSGFGYSNIVLIDVKAPHVFTHPEAIKVRPTYLVLSGEVANAFGKEITERGFVCSTSPNPTLKTTGVKRSFNGGVGPGVFQARIDTLSPNTLYNVRAFARHEDGVGYGPNILVQTMPAFAIGQVYGGGKIVYIGANKSEGIVASEEDLPLLSQADSTWGCPGKNVFTQDALGAGLPNTVNIMMVCDSANIAARKCAEYVRNGFSDWYLPSKEECREMVKSLASSLPGEYYWSSSQENANNAWLVKKAGNNPTYLSEPKQGSPGITKSVRAVRKFD